MELKLLFWHWLALGMLLLLVEIFIPTFTIFWFGLGCFIVALLLWLMPDMSLNWQLLIWIVASCIFAFLWFKYFKPLMVDKTKAGISREAIMGESGQVIKAAKNNQHGVVRFTTPVLGDDEWPFICDTDAAVGDRVFIKDISGNTLVVEKR
jgi:inner membrane protein